MEKEIGVTDEGEKLEGRRSELRLLALVGVAGAVALVAGLVLGAIAYDKRYFPEGGDLAARLRGETLEPSPVWEAVSWIGYLLTLCGLLAIVASVVGVLIVGTSRLVRGVAR